MIEREHIDLVVLDIMMPKMDFKKSTAVNKNLEKIITFLFFFDIVDIVELTWLIEKILKNSI